MTVGQPTTEYPGQASALFILVGKLDLQRQFGS